MSVKIDRFQIIDFKLNNELNHRKSIGIKDYKYEEIIVTFDLNDKKLNFKLAEVVLKELNKEFESE